MKSSARCFGLSVKECSVKRIYVLVYYLEANFVAQCIHLKMENNTPLSEEFISGSSESGDQSILRVDSLRNLENVSSPVIPFTTTNSNYGKTLLKTETTVNMLESPNTNTLISFIDDRDLDTKEKPSKFPELFDSSSQENPNLMSDEIVNNELIKTIVESLKDNNAHSSNRTINDKVCKELVSNNFADLNNIIRSVESINIERMCQNDSCDLSIEANSRQNIHQHVNDQLSMELPKNKNIQSTVNFDENQKNASNTAISEEYYSKAEGVVLYSNTLQAEYPQDTSNLEFSHENDMLFANRISCCCLSSKGNEVNNEELCSQPLFSTEMTQSRCYYENEKFETVLPETVTLNNGFPVTEPLENVNTFSVDNPCNLINTREVIQNSMETKNSDSKNIKAIVLESGLKTTVVEGQNFMYKELSRACEGSSPLLPDIQLKEANNAYENTKLQELSFQEQNFDINADLTPNSPSLLESTEDGNFGSQIGLNLTNVSSEDNIIQSTSGNEKFTYVYSKLTVTCAEKKECIQNNKRGYGLNEERGSISHHQEIYKCSSEVTGKHSATDKTNISPSIEDMQSFDSEETTLHDRGIEDVQKDPFFPENVNFQNENSDISKIDAIEKGSRDTLSLDKPKNLLNEWESEDAMNNYSKNEKTKIFFKSGNSRCKKYIDIPWKSRDLNDEETISDIQAHNKTACTSQSTGYNKFKGNPTVSIIINHANTNVEKTFISHQLEPMGKKEAGIHNSSEIYTNNKANNVISTILEKQNELKSVITKSDIQSETGKDLIHKETDEGYLVQRSKRYFDTIDTGKVIPSDEYNEIKKLKLDINLHTALEQENVYDNSLSVQLNVISPIRVNNLSSLTKQENAEKIDEDSEGNSEEIILSTDDRCPILRAQRNLLKSPKNLEAMQHGCEKDGKTGKCAQTQNEKADGKCFSSEPEEISQTREDILTESVECTSDNDEEFTRSEEIENSHIQNKYGGVNTEAKANEFSREQEIVADLSNAIQSTENNASLSHIQSCNIETIRFNRLNDNKRHLHSKNKFNFSELETTFQRKKRTEDMSVKLTDCSNKQYINTKNTGSRRIKDSETELCFEHNQEVESFMNQAKYSTKIKTNNSKNSISSSKTGRSTCDKRTKISSRKRKEKLMNSDDTDKMWSKKNFVQNMKLLLEATEHKMKRAEKIVTTEKIKENINYYNIVHACIILKQLEPILIKAELHLRRKNPGKNINLLSSKIQQLKCYHNKLYLEAKTLIPNNFIDFKFNEKPLEGSKRIEKELGKKAASFSKQENDDGDVAIIYEYIENHSQSKLDLKSSVKASQQEEENDKFSSSRKQYNFNETKTRKSKRIAQKSRCNGLSTLKDTDVTNPNALNEGKKFVHTKKFDYYLSENIGCMLKFNSKSNNSSEIKSSRFINTQNTLPEKQNLCERNTLSSILLEFKDAVSERKEASETGLITDVNSEPNMHNLDNELTSNQLKKKYICKRTNVNLLPGTGITNTVITQKLDDVNDKCIFNSSNNCEVFQACEQETFDSSSQSLLLNIAQKSFASNISPLSSKMAAAVTETQNSNPMQYEIPALECSKTINSKIAHAQQNRTYSDDVLSDCFTGSGPHFENCDTVYEGKENIRMLHSSRQCSSYVNQKFMEDTRSESLLRQRNFAVQDCRFQPNTMQTFSKMTVSAGKIRGENSLQPKTVVSETNIMNSFEAITAKTNAELNLSTPYSLIDPHIRNKHEDKTYFERTENCQPVLKNKESQISLMTKEKCPEGINKNTIIKPPSKMDIMSLVRSGILKPDYNVLTVHTPEKLHFASLDKNGSIISESGKSYDSLVKWCKYIPNLFKNEKLTKIKCFKRVYYQGRNLLHYVRSYQGLTDLRSSQENQIFLHAVDGSTAPMGGSLLPVVLNLSKMKLLLIGNNEVETTSTEIDQWTDIDKWEM